MFLNAIWSLVLSLICRLRLRRVLPERKGGSVQPQHMRDQIRERAYLMLGGWCPASSVAFGHDNSGLGADLGNLRTRAVSLDHSRLRHPPCERLLAPLSASHHNPLHPQDEPELVPESALPLAMGHARLSCGRPFHLCSLHEIQRLAWLMVVAQYGGVHSSMLHGLACRSRVQLRSILKVVAAEVSWMSLEAAAATLAMRLVMDGAERRLATAALAEPSQENKREQPQPRTDGVSTARGCLY